jgi:hypothetical protein
VTLVAGGPHHTGARRWIGCCLALPAVVLIGSYAWLAIEHRTMALGDVVVHESGRYTLTETIFYFNHFLREIPTLITIVMLVLVAYRPINNGGQGDRRRLRARGIALIAAGAGLCVAAFIFAARHSGAETAVSDLLQYRTRDDLHEFGSHWRFHWLSTVWLGVAASLLATIGCNWGVPAKPRSLRDRPVQLVWLGFLVVSAVFGFSREILVDGRYIGHQAREILTHGLVTLPLATAVVSMVALWSSNRTRGSYAPPNWSRAEIVLFVVIPAYLGMKVLTGDVMAAGQTDAGLSAMVASHMFEHVLDYIFVALVAAGGYQLSASLGS